MTKPRQSTLEVPIADCLVCGHRMPLAIWNGTDPAFGVCEGCRQNGRENRGPCTPERGCSCERPRLK